MRFERLALLGLLVCAAPASQAQNLVTNPGFETGDFTGWTTAGSNYFVDAGVGRNGTYAAAFGALSPDVDDVSQVLATQSGQQYTLTFFAQTPEFNNPPGFPNALAVYFDGSLIDGPFTVPDAPGYQQYSYTVTATSATSLLRFTVSNDPDFTQLDDISVTPVPEPGSISLLVAIGISGAGFLARRKQGRPEFA